MATSKTPIPPRAFKGLVENKILAAIAKTASTMNRLAKPNFTADELLDLFVEPRNHRLLRDAFAESHGASIGHNLYVSLTSWSKLNFEVRGNLSFGWFHHTVPNGFFPPAIRGGRQQHPLIGVRDGCRPENRDKFLETMERMVRISYEWGLVRRVFNDLNQPGFCATPHQMRYVWPSILPLLKRCDGEDRLIAELQQESLRAGDKARVPLPIQPFIKESYDIVTRAILLIEHEAPDKTQGINYSLQEPKFATNGILIEGFV